jgi:hypothetical protein
MILDAPGSPAARYGATAAWQTTAPPGITINHIRVIGASSHGIGDGEGYYGEFFWNEGDTGRVALTDSYSSYGCCQANFNSQHIGWYFTCEWSSCSNSVSLWTDQLELTATENRAPGLLAIGANNLWYQHGWVRGTWPMAFAASDPSGVCAMTAVLGSQVLAGPHATPNQGSWQQCPQGLWGPTVDTRASNGSLGLGEGRMPLILAASNAAGVTAAPIEMVSVDNESPTITLSGPTDASSSTGTQYITATASAGPSGVRGILCSVDGSPFQFHAGATAQLPVQGIGVHTATCYSQSNAVDANGGHGTSAIRRWSLSIRQPSVSALSFAVLKSALRCTKHRGRVLIPAHWVTVRYRGRRVRVKVPAQTRRITMVHCRPRIVRRRVRVDGHWRTVRVVVLPHTALQMSRRVGYGRSATITGWLATAQGNALADQRVRILAAPDNGRGAFAQVGAATTGPDGSWSARLPPGPSRLVEAVYDGSATVEPSASAPARTVVPSSLSMQVRPHATHWGATIQIRGRVRGGYIPRAGELVVLWIGWPGGSTEIGHLYTHRDGRFGSTYTFLRGNGRERYHLWAATAKESDYPYAPNRSRPVGVTVTP